MAADVGMGVGGTVGESGGTKVCGGVGVGGLAVGVGSGSVAVGVVAVGEGAGVVAPCRSTSETQPAIVSSSKMNPKTKRVGIRFTWRSPNRDLNWHQSASRA